MGLKGDLTTMALEDVLQWLAVGKKTGILELHGFLHSKRVSFAGGRISGVWSTDPREYLGQYLLAFNRITEEQLREALASQEDENQLLGRILVNRQLVTEAEIRRIVQLKVDESLYDAFLWEFGTFEFFDGAAPPQKAMLLSLDVTGIVLEGARRVDEWKRIKKVIWSGDAVVEAVPEAIAEQLPLVPQDADVLARLNGTKTLDQLVIEMRATDFKIHKQVFDLHEKGLIRVVHPGGRIGEYSGLHLQRARRMVEQEMLKEAQVELRKLLEEEPDLPEAVRMLDVVDHMLGDTQVDENLVLELAVSLDDLMQASLGPNEAFLATRANGVWTVKDIISIAPFTHEECLTIFSKLLKRGILKGQAPAQESARPQARPN
ncbi:MAG: DUF4388 domain-containing protein [Firmicutes bacterium]|nr:DUF4388 domain-containing protein [Bacillota bacterium]